jgi:hypothetical protein
MTAPAQDAPATTPEVPKIYAAIWKVMRAVTSVKKGGQYNEGRTVYSFRSIDDLARDLGSAFRDFGVFVQAEQLEHQMDRERETRNGAKFTTVVVKMRYRFTSLEDGSTLSFEVRGEGADTADKATMKAHTMALKTALGQAFLLPTDEKDPDTQRPGDEDYGQPVGQGQGQGYDPNQAARDRHAAQRQAAGDAGVNPPQANGTRAEKVAQWVDWVRREFANEAMTLERLAFIHMLTSQKQLLGVDAAGVPLETRIKAELARWQLDPNGAMPTPEQAVAYMARQQGTTNHPSEVES